MCSAMWQYLHNIVTHGNIHDKDIQSRTKISHILKYRTQTYGTIPVAQSAEIFIDLGGKKTNCKIF